MPALPITLSFIDFGPVLITEFTYFFLKKMTKGKISPWNAVLFLLKNLLP